jgi:eukaryotic-like serine/threonine-protein kinase
MSPAPDREVGGRYRLRSRLGSGGMATVWLADDPVLQRQVAVKEVRFDHRPDDEETLAVRARFLREARAAARLNHPSSTTIYDVVREGDAAAFIVMELVRAPTLAQLVSRDGPLPPRRAAHIGLDLLAALRAAHREGIVHRDVKPGNVMVPEEGRAKLTDFGVAALVDDPRLTSTGVILGSPSSMAPEQATGAPASPATDLWGLGATLYFAVEGVGPFDRGEPIPTLTAVVNEPPRPPQGAGPLGPLLERLLAKDAADRPDPADVEDELRAVAAGQAASTLVAPAPIPPPRPAPPPPPPQDHPVGGRRSRPAAFVTLVAVLGLLALAAVFAARALGPAADGGQEAAPDPAPAEPDTPDPGEQDPGPAEQDPVQGEADPAPTDPVTEPAADRDQPPADADQGPAAEDAEAPEGWRTFPVGPDGATVAHPPDWTPQDRGGNRTDLVDPDGGRYLRLDWTDTPADDPVADWQAQSQSFGSRHQGYEEIRIEPVSFKDADAAALWEYRYMADGATLHAYNLGFVAGGHGYALNFQTTEDQWADSQQLWEQLRDSFSTG